MPRSQTGRARFARETILLALQPYAERCAERLRLLDRAVEIVVDVCRATPDVREAFAFGSYAIGTVGPTSDLDVLVVRDTDAGIVDRVLDLKLAARAAVSIDFVVVTPAEYATTFRSSSFGRTAIEQARRIYAA